jgi:hypothetical protein
MAFNPAFVQNPPSNGTPALASAMSMQS